jgi:endogenous inhibitor of DNA gyrase (YacG/DUF329 family)
MASRQCPQCGTPTAWQGNPSRPFCSERCRLVDLEGWLGERYAIPGEPLSPDGGEDLGSGDASSPVGAAGSRGREAGNGRDGARSRRSGS